MSTAATEIKPDTQKERPQHPILKLCATGMRVVLQQKGGVIIIGIPKWFRKGYLKLMDAQLEGRNHKVSVPWVIIEHGSIAHIHPEGSVQKLDEQDGETKTL